ncbi:MAG: hypothetical protein KBD78_09210 [Oligoflexales bacterium]|nr:hypothetical protein [Oligoflexales bacterium]
MVANLYGIFKPITLSVALATLLSCGQNNDTLSSVSDLNPGPDSNIKIAGLAKEINAKDVNTVKILPNTLVPKGLMVYLIGSGPSSSFNNWKFITELYESIHNINVNSGLQPTVGLATVGEAELKNQEITLVVMHSKGEGSYYNKFVTHVDKYMANKYPNFDGRLRLAPMETIERNSWDLWIQDFGEFAMASVDGVADDVYMVVDTNRNENRGVFSPEVFQKLFGIPLVHLGSNVDNSAQYGGNIEATPEGVFYMGDSVDDPSYSADGKTSPLFDIIKSKGNPDGKKLSSNWLAVGHVDEYMTYIPSNQTCSSTLVWGSPLLALKMMLEQASDQEFKFFSDEFAELYVGYDPNDQDVYVDVHLTRQQIKAALDSFAKAPSAIVSSNIADYDLSKAPKLFAELEKGVNLGYKDMMKLIRDPKSIASFYVWRNLVDQKNILASVETVQKDRACQQSVEIPQAMLPNFAVDANYGYGIWYKDSAHLPGMTNALVLRDSAIMGDPWVQTMRDYVKKEVGLHLGGAEKIQFVDDLVYHYALGEVHCATNVIREKNMQFTF